MFKFKNSQLGLPESKEVKAHIIKSLESYWIKSSSCVSNLPIRTLSNVKIIIPLRLISITLPEWAQNYGIAGKNFGTSRIG